MPAGAFIYNFLDYTTTLIMKCNSFMQGFVSWAQNSSFFMLVGYYHQAMWTLFALGDVIFKCFTRAWRKSLYTLGYYTLQLERYILICVHDKQIWWTSRNQIEQTNKKMYVLIALIYDVLGAVKIGWNLMLPSPKARVAESFPNSGSPVMGEYSLFRFFSIRICSAWKREKKLAYILIAEVIISLSFVVEWKALSCHEKGLE